MILISSHEYQFEIVNELKQLGLGEKVYVIYDDTARSFLDVLTAFPSYKNSAAKPGAVCPDLLPS